MKKNLAHIALVAGFIAAGATLQAQPTAHYVPGVEGIKGASLPPPGWYLRDYNVGYYATTANNGSGNSATPPNFKAFTYANVPRLVWITDQKVLGANLGVDALLPVIYQSLQAGPYSSSVWGDGDFFAEATLSWHFEQFDLSAGAGCWAPSGDFQLAPATSVGLGYWEPMLTAGGTWYPDEAKTWSASALCRYEIPTEQRVTRVTPGQAITVEWGLSKSVAKGIDLGAAGYYQQKVTRDTGPALFVSPEDRVAAVGPEVCVAIPKPVMMFLSLRYDYEFTSRNRAQGNTLCLTLTHPF